MTRQQLEHDAHGEDFEREEDIAQLEHYQLYGTKPRLMPDVNFDALKLRYFASVGGFLG